MLLVSSVLVAADFFGISFTPRSPTSPRDPLLLGVVCWRDFLLLFDISEKRARRELETKVWGVCFQN